MPTIIEVPDESGTLAAWFDSESVHLRASAQEPEDRQSSSRFAETAEMIATRLRAGGMIDLDELGDVGIAYFRSALGMDGAATHAVREARWADLRVIAEALETLDDLETPAAA